MNELVLSTWSWGAVANEPAWVLLRAGAPALDAVVAGATAVEDDESIDSVGVGGLPDVDGVVSLDAAVMTDPDTCGAVADLRGYPQATAIARRVMERTVHIMLAGGGAAEFARRESFEPRELLTAKARTRWRAWLRRLDESGHERYTGWIPPANREEPDKFPDPPIDDREPPTHDTVGIIARDAHGRLAAACSTSGMALKVPGRVGDSPLIGHGLYVDQQAGAAVATGNGELIMGVCGSFLVVELMRQGRTPAEACHAALQRVVDRFELTAAHQVAFIAVAPASQGGKWASASLRRGFRHVVTDAGGTRVERPHGILR